MSVGGRPDSALAPFGPGERLSLVRGDWRVDVAPRCGGRLARIRHGGREWLQDHGAGSEAMIGWGCYPMVPWAGRIRHGCFSWNGANHRLATNLDGHAIHGVGFALPWQVDSCGADYCELSLALPRDGAWPFGGYAWQRIALSRQGLRLELAVTAGELAMPVSIGWHPWFAKPEHIEFHPRMAYLRSADGITDGVLTKPFPGPWDDCFVNDAPIVLQLAGNALRLTSDCDHWVVFDGNARATCVEPQSGPPNAFNLQPEVLAPGQRLSRWFALEAVESPGVPGMAEGESPDRE